MIATRGLKPAVFSVGERVLCFEPDPTKVKVLYDSKILKVDWTRDEGGKRTPEYLVHFNGWNSSWDRWAPENFILKFTDENLELQDQLREEAEEKMRKKRRKRTWTEILEEAKEREKVAKESASSEDNISDTTDDSDVGDENGAVEVPISFPEALRAKMEDDCYFITSKKQLVNLPPDHTALEVMEAYLKDFAYRCRVHNVRVHARQQGTAGMPVSIAAATNVANGESVVPPPQPQFNVDLCREVMDGLRILFDFFLPTNLLYGCERAQYASLYPERPLQANGVKEEQAAKPKVQITAAVRSTRLRSASPSKESPPVLEPANRSPTDEFPPVLKPETTSLEGIKEARDQEKENKKEKVKEEEMEPEEPPARRITRRSSTSNFNQTSPPPQGRAPAPTQTPPATRELRSSDKHKTPDTKLSLEKSEKIRQRAEKIREKAEKKQEAKKERYKKAEGSHQQDKHHRHHHHQQDQQSQPSSRSLRHSARLASHSSVSPSSSPPRIVNMESIPALEASPPPAVGGGSSHGNKGEGIPRSGARAEAAFSRGHKDVGKIPQTGECSIKQEEAVTMEDGIMVERSCWKLLKEEANYNGAEPPCRVYGPQHLLRLFVKLPEILGGMDLQSRKLKPLVKHVEMFLRWLSATDQLLEYFPDKAYVNADSAMTGTNKTRRSFAGK